MSCKIWGSEPRSVQSATTSQAPPDFQAMGQSMRFIYVSRLGLVEGWCACVNKVLKHFDNMSNRRWCRAETPSRVGCSCCCGLVSAVIGCWSGRGRVSIRCSGSCQPTPSNRTVFRFAMYLCIGEVFQASSLPERQYSPFSIAFRVCLAVGNKATRVAKALYASSDPRL